MKKCFFLLALVLPMLTGYAMPNNQFSSACSSPQNVTVISKASGSISFDWDGVDAATYEVYYVDGNGNASSVIVTSSSDFVFGGLPAGTYDFYFRTDCGAAMSDWVGIEEVIIG